VTIRKKLFFFCILLSLFFASSSVNAQFEVKTFNFETDSMPYLLLKPLNYDSTKTYPLLLFLHGSGERGNDNKRTLTHIESLLTADSNRLNFPAFVIVPQCDTGYRWIEVDWKANSHLQPTTPSRFLNMTIKLLELVENNFPIDSKRIYVTGLSMGGFGTWDLIARLPNKFAAAAPICGGADTTTAKVIAHIPIWVFHGADDKIVKVERSRDIVNALLTLGSKLKYSEYKDVGHDSWKPAYREPDFLKWMFGQRKG
jgi:predicted peptidase